MFLICINIYHGYLGIMWLSNDEEQNKIMTNTGEREWGTNLIKNWTRVKVDQMITGRGVPKRECARSLAGLLLLVRLLRLLFTTGVALRGPSCALLTHAGHMRVRCLLPVWESSWEVASPGCDFPDWWLCLLLLPPCLDLEPELSWACFLGECSLHALPCDDFLGIAVSPEQSEMCLFICWPDIVTSTQTPPTHEVCVVMHALTMWLRYAGSFWMSIGTEWATWYPWLVPVLGFVRLEDWITCKCVAHMQLL